MVWNPFHRWRYPYGIFHYLQVQGKAIPSQVWTNPEDFRRLRLPDFKTIDT